MKVQKLILDILCVFRDQTLPSLSKDDYTIEVLTPIMEISFGNVWGHLVGVTPVFLILKEKVETSR